MGLGVTTVRDGHPELFIHAGVRAAPDRTATKKAQLAMTYSCGGLRPDYHRRGRA